MILKKYRYGLNCVGYGTVINFRPIFSSLKEAEIDHLCPLIAACRQFLPSIHCHVGCRFALWRIKSLCFCLFQIAAIDGFCPLFDDVIEASN